MLFNRPQNKPIFFIHTIDPILWPILMIFVRPFFEIVCFQVNRVKICGFSRLEMSSLTAGEFENSTREAIALTRGFAVPVALNTSVEFGALSLDFTNYFAKDYFRFATDLVLAAKMIHKQPKRNGVFILNYFLRHQHLHDKTLQIFQQQSGLKHSQVWEFCLWIYALPLKLLTKSLLVLLAFGVLFFRKRTDAPSETGSDKLIFISHIPSELEPDFLRKLSAGFFIDGKKILKENVLFLSRESKEAESWRAAGYQIQSIYNCLGFKGYLKALNFCMALMFGKPRFVFEFLWIFSPKIFVAMIFGEILLQQNKFCGLLYTNSDVMMEPIISASFKARKLSVGLFFYSASGTMLPVWSYLQANHVFIWNAAMIDFLEAHPQNEKFHFLVVGPLMQVEDQVSQENLLLLRREFSLDTKPGRVRIGVFDIAPIKTQFLEDSRLVQNPSLTPHIHRDFLLNIFKLGEDDSTLQFILKPKRWTPKHDIDPEISNYLTSHKDSILLLSPNLNPQIAIQSCDVVICFPYTSIFFAALQKNVPAVFYYPQDDDWLKNNSELQPFTIYGPDKLKAWFNEFKTNKAAGLNEQTIKTLCGIAPQESVRAHFIEKLSGVFYAP